MVGPADHRRKERLAATLLVLRVETAVTLTTLLVLTTPWMHILKSLRSLHVPQEVVMMLAMTHRYVFLLAETAGQMFESRQSRTVGELSRSAAASCDGADGRCPAEQEHRTEQRRVPGDAVARLSRRRARAGRFPNARSRLSRVGGISRDRCSCRMDGPVMTSTTVFAAENVNFTYDQIPALRDFSLKIERGQSVALVGANGSGKSTLLRLLDALCFPTSGSISFCGAPLTDEALRDAGFFLSFRRRVALVFQNPDVQLFNPTVFDEVAFGPLQMGWSRHEVIARVNGALEQMGITQLRDRPPYRLSGGEKKRVALASVMVLDPEVLLLDEPTAMLDPRSQSQLIDLIQNWKGSTRDNRHRDPSDRDCRGYRRPRCGAGAGKCHRGRLAARDSRQLRAFTSRQPCPRPPPSPWRRSALAPSPALSRRAQALTRAQ